MGKTGGGPGTNQYQIKGMSKEQMRRRAEGRHRESTTELAGLERTFEAVPIEAVRLLGAAEADLGRFRARTTKRAMSRYMVRRAEFVYSAAYLEGNTFTLPEVRTLLDGVTPDGKRVEETSQILALQDASLLLLDRVESGTFSLDLGISDELNAIVAKDESLDPGVRRTRSTVNPDVQGVTVSVMGDTFVSYRVEALATAEHAIVERTLAEPHPILRSVSYATMAAYAQMYSDGNKRTGRYMMDGELMRHGFDAIAIPAARKREYNETLAVLFREGDAIPHSLFLLDILARDEPVEGSAG